MPPKMGLRVRSCFHNAFSAVDCQEISGRFWPAAVFDDGREPARSRQSEDSLDDLGYSIDEVFDLLFCRFCRIPVTTLVPEVA